MLLTTAFKLMDTNGTPLSIQLILAQERGATISLPHYYRDALLAGWKPTTAIARIREALSDVGTDQQYIDAALMWLSTHRELPAD